MTTLEAVGEEQIIWKGKLLELYAQWLKMPLTKDDIEYVVEDDPETSGFVATIKCGGFSASYMGPAAPSKKLAEQGAARQAMLNEFPDVAAQFEAMDGQQQLQPVGPRAGKGAGLAAQVKLEQQPSERKL